MRANSAEGFTLLELTVAIVVASLLTGAAVGALPRALEADGRAELQQLLARAAHQAARTGTHVEVRRAGLPVPRTSGPAPRVGIRADLPSGEPLPSPGSIRRWIVSPEGIVLGLGDGSAGTTLVWLSPLHQRASER